MNFRKALALSLLSPLLFAAGASAQLTARFGNATTLLPDGNVLFTGGSTPGNAVSNSVQMYNMATNAYVVWAGGLNVPRSSHTATLMSDGRVLVAGGLTSGNLPTNDLEICDPISRTCAGAGVDMITARAWHTATLLSKGPRAGQVLLCGGKTGVAADTFTVTEACETFDPTGPSVANAGAMVSQRMGHAAVLLRSGKVFVAGGVRPGTTGTPQWVYEPLNEIYDPVALQWTPVSALLKGRIHHSATVLNNGTIVIAGGYNETNKMSCKGDLGSKNYDCWHIYVGGGGQNNGNQGYLDGAEFYDQNGGRVVLSEESQNEIPYRVSQHTSVLMPDGRWKIQGGYGNIFPTFFSNGPALTSNTVFHLTQIAGSTHTATINPNSFVEFPLDFKLSRPVSGRIVDADAFISGPPTPGNPSVQFETVKLYLPASVSHTDGVKVGSFLCADPTDPGCPYKPGDFKSTVSLFQPTGSATFEKYTTGSGNEDYPTTATGSNMTMNPNPLLPTEAGRAITGSLTANVNITVPDVYANIKGVAKLISGQLSDDGNDYAITFTQSGKADFDLLGVAPLVCSVEERNCVYSAVLTFTGVAGTISNLTTLESGTTFYNTGTVVGTGVNINGGMINGDNVTLSLEIDFMARDVSALDREPAYSFDASTYVVREMVFSTQLGYTPKTNKWDDLNDVNVSPALFSPVFNHSAMLTPAGDLWVKGGRNCELAPAVDCRRATDPARRFVATSSGTVYVTVFKAPDDTAKWPKGPPMATARAFHTSTVLPTGAVLTCGGSDGVRALSSCELLDPATRTWLPTGSMNMARANHTATLLPNGTVLAAGGVNPSGVAISSAEVYYPDTQRWVPTTSMANARQLHTATLLPDGNVLVAGGATLSTYSNSAEIYISSTAYWMNTAGNLVTGRSQHTATLLKNGNVLLAGGVNAFGALKKAEVYNYIARTFSARPDMATARYAHTANQLRDGNVLVAGGSDGIEATGTAEVFDGTSWIASLGYTYPRANHRTLLLPNGKLMSTGGEFRSVAQSVPEGFDPDFRGWSEQGETVSRSHHTSVMTADNKMMNIGGWSGGAYLNSTEYADFNYYPDMSGLSAETTRQAIISTATSYFNQASTVTLLSGTSNFHGITEASGGGAGSMNSSFHNPRVYLQQIDNPSGFMIDLSTRIYTRYTGTNSNWERTLSSITVIMPVPAGELPNGWYHLRSAAAAVFSNPVTVQVTIPRPSGLVDAITGTVLGTSSITWNWNSGTIGAADGYSIYSATDNVFVTTVAFAAGNASYTQAGLVPNTAASIMISAYNIGGNGPLAKSSTYYTLAARPEPLNITAASFETAQLEWARNNNSGLTAYEVSMSPVKTPKFSDPLAISTPVPFSVNYLSTSTVVQQLSANQMYDFRVRAMNGSGLVTAFSTPASTITISGVNNFSGQALSSSTINWSWDAAVGASYYELYDVTNGTSAAVLIGSTTTNNLSQTALAANRLYYAVVSAVNDTSGFGPIRGPLSYPQGVYTLTVQPLPATPNVFTNVSTGSLTVNWITNGNSTWTVYRVGMVIDDTVTSSVTTSDSWQAFAGLTPNVKHAFTVTPINGDGISGTALDLGYKYTLAKVPGSLTADEITMSGISLSWDNAGNSANTVYEVRSSTSDVFADPVTKNLPFSFLETGTSLFVSGLLTSTSYYFDVAACNGEGVLGGCVGYGVTARKRAIAAFTLPGPSGAPAGSVAGTSEPAADTVITGVLPNNRTVSLSVPAGAFESATAIAISSSATNVCGFLAGGVTPVEVAVYTQDGRQPQVPVTLTLRFDMDPTVAKNDIITKASQVVLARYNPVSGQCLPLETKVNVGARTITATLNHFSLFQLMVRSAAADLSNVLVYPNPFYTNRGQGFVTIDRIPANSKVRIYTLSGDKVWESSAGSTGVVIWKGVNSSGNIVASGIYLAVVDSSAGKKVLKLAVER